MNNVAFRIIQNFNASACVTQKLVGIAMQDNYSGSAATAGNQEDQDRLWQEKAAQLAEAASAIFRLEAKLDALSNLVNEEEYNLNNRRTA